MLSTTFAGSTCHADRGGGPWARAPAAGCSAGCAGAGAGAVQRLLNTSVCSVPAAAFAAATWASTELADCASALAVKSPKPKPDAAITPITYVFRSFIAGLRDCEVYRKAGFISLHAARTTHQNAKLRVRRERSSIWRKQRVRFLQAITR